MQYSNALALRVGELPADVLNLRITQEVVRERPDTMIVDVPVSTNPAALVATPHTFAAPAAEVLTSDSRKSVLYVRNVLGQPLPFATVMLGGGSPQVTDTTGRMVMNTNADSVHVVVRRMGYTSLSGSIGRASREEPFRVVLQQSAQSLARIDVLGRREKSPLERNGFYDRMLDVQRGAIVG
ncbi:MAG: hypothetical protein H7Z40_08145, partial [Phycisphaerae bacterium]|nr:hypothetical protein [Gemmatimonadaceae bacterium]